MEGDGVIILRADLVKKGYSVYCRVQVSDSGPGIPEDLLDKVFNPYFTTRDEGTGLGLSIIERIIHDHKDASGLSLPREKEPPFILICPMRSCMEKILIIDDEPSVREVLSDILSDEGYDILEGFRMG